MKGVTPAVLCNQHDKEKYQLKGKTQPPSRRNMGKMTSSNKDLPTDLTGARSPALAPINDTGGCEEQTSSNRASICLKVFDLDKMQPEGSSTMGPVFRVEGQSLQLFAVTPTSVSLFSLHENPPRKQTLDQIGCNANAVTMSDRLDLVIGRPEAVYFYEVDGRGPCWAFDGEKKLLGWFRGYLVCINV
ncbi:hypothetical protein HPP92_013598 [Vanilla planifolia]|uniref:Uncharacterized protein n=1 Tax=Vanilla planifolia TaxID=51239 RepID=A0A835QVX3_VANPL|nr:hypothetical protein HPP92_014036 [Vanilla planifolia]KAG0478879.1 hypothetical protein HPP92_013598 [Vanilla planifolia]